MNSDTKNQTHSFNIIDMLIIAAIIAVAVFGVYMLSGDIFESRIHTVEYCIRLDGVTDFSAVSELETGNRLYSTELNIPAGIIKRVNTENMKNSVFDKAKNRYVIRETNGIYSVYIYLDAGCVYENGAYRTENIRISENTEIDVNVPFLYDSAHIVSVNPIINTEDN